MIKASVTCRECDRPFLCVYRTKKFFYCSEQCMIEAHRRMDTKRVRNKRIRRFARRVAIEAALQLTGATNQ